MYLSERQLERSLNRWFPTLLAADEVPLLMKWTFRSGLEFLPSSALRVEKIPECNPLCIGPYLTHLDNAEGEKIEECKENDDPDQSRIEIDRVLRA